MSTWSGQNSSASMQRLADWFAQPLGQYLLNREADWFGRTLDEQYGWTAVQLGLPQVNLMANCRVRQRLLLGRGECVHIAADTAALPFANASIDVLLLPHVLDFCADPHQVIREAQRVLIPDGKLLISGFNPYSLWGMRRLLNARPEPWNGNFISLPRLKDWLALLGFEMRASAMTCYIPPLSQPKWQQRWRFMEPAGNRWWPAAGAVYCLQASKQVLGMRLTGLIKPRRLVRKPRLVSAHPDVQQEQHE
ncbi:MULTISPECIES: class I SAM-dependent methyltransferase [Leeia]|uniref:Methyltransferase domain-containing protein n=1 Tax=Leeia aquatica TaxID=2725557 RepID=A0A847S4F4_9NEIS|nr:class I SAM-dependent methyltransferase [Leeia aquatica]NLR73635.1 methyltransferase domain-containing protein [Leeia aquatica]